MGTGPGELNQLSRRALEALEQAEVVVGYKTYIELISGLLGSKEVVSTGMTREVERCNQAIDKALEGRKVALVSSGDPGIYGMAGLAIELLEQRGALEDVDLEVIPGITSATAAAACLGAPLMHDFVVISLSDLLTPWEVIEKRLELAARGDFVVVLYNPASKKRKEQIRIARNIMLEHKSAKTPVGIVRNAARENEERVITDLARMLDHPIDMFTTIIIGNSQTRPAGKYMVTPRGYRV
ncbi:MAG: precorrin-3B C17-methyltransferase / cobalt-factor methyltransferase [Thermoanaerobacter sp.]|nr:precorrin-3B C17-methyltransferase / cobalt-factor methyltransferase [Thermoanaerobacter sp.]